MSVLTTSELSLGQIDDEDGRKRYIEHFLTLSAFFGSGEIKENLFKCYVGNDSPHWLTPFMTNDHWDRLKFEEVIAELVKLSLLQQSEAPWESQKDCIHFSLHPMIRDWIQLRVARHDRHRFVMEVIMILDSYIAQYGKVSSPSITQEILAHQDVCVYNDAVH